MNAITSSTFEFYERAALHTDLELPEPAPQTLPFHVMRLGMNPYKAVVPAVDEVVIRLCVTLDTPVRVRDGDRWKLAGMASTQSVILSPAGQPCEFDAPNEHDMIVIGCGKHAFFELLGDHGLDPQHVEMVMSSVSVIHDTRVTALVLDVWRETTRTTASGMTLVIHGYWKLLVAAVVSALLRPQKTTCFGLSRKALCRIDSFIGDNLSEPISATDLAELVGMSTSRFTKEFRNAKDMTPYQYVLKQRVDRARMHIAANEQPLASIAVICGFSSQSHMTDTFRVKLGQTPAMFRAAKA